MRNYYIAGLLALLVGCACHHEDYGLAPTPDHDPFAADIKCFECKRVVGYVDCQLPDVHMNPPVVIDAWFQRYKEHEKERELIRSQIQADVNAGRRLRIPR